MNPELIVEAVFRIMVKAQHLDLVTLTTEVRKVCEHRGIKQDGVAPHLLELYDKYGISKTY